MVFYGASLYRLAFEFANIVKVGILFFESTANLVIFRFTDIDKKESLA